jgi:hypothetical protein
LRISSHFGLLAALLATALLAGAQQRNNPPGGHTTQRAAPAAAQPSRLRAAERTLAGLQPGRDTLARAVRLYGDRYTEAFANTPDLLLWSDARKHIFLRLELGDDKTIQTITVSSFGPDGRPATDLPLNAAASGRRLKLGDPLDKCLNIYGQPYFRGPSTEAGQELLLVVYKFAVSEEFPQVLETSYDPKTLRLVKMTLSFPYY